MNMKKQNRKNRIRVSRLTASFCAAAMLFGGLPGLRAGFANAEEELVLEHVHTDSCYSTGRHLICGLEENPGHVHTDECRERIRGALLCDNNTGDHIHGDECYEWTTELTCGMEEGEGVHSHCEDCYEEEQVLICGLENNTELPPDVVEVVEETIEPEVIEEPETPETEPEPEMNPGDGIVSLLQMERELNFADVSDPTADVEDETDWWRMFADMELSGNWAQDLLMVAESQLGYTESALNFDNEDPWNPKGYTRYGAWFGLPYGDWCAMFISFCLYYAEIPDSVIPYNCHCLKMVRELAERGLYRHWDTGYTPKPGDLIFFDFNMDEDAEHVGIVRAVDPERGWIYTIEGNRYDYVEHFTLTKDDYAIIGYGELPENPNYNPDNPVVERFNGKVELPPDPVEPTPPRWDSVLDAAAGIRSVEIVPTIEASRVTY